MIGEADWPIGVEAVLRAVTFLALPDAGLVAINPDVADLDHLVEASTAEDDRITALAVAVAFVPPRALGKPDALACRQLVYKERSQVACSRVEVVRKSAVPLDDNTPFDCEIANESAWFFGAVELFRVA
jgi:hypothetical protein